MMKGGNPPRTDRAVTVSRAYGYSVAGQVTAITRASSSSVASASANSPATTTSITIAGRPPRRASTLIRRVDSSRSFSSREPPACICMSTSGFHSSPKMAGESGFSSERSLV